MIKIRPLFNAQKLTIIIGTIVSYYPHCCRYVLNLLYTTRDTEETGSTIEERVRMDEEES
jgi:hypothetical protein